jgi:TetR/AcrR family transcriptional regulator
MKRAKAAKRRPGRRSVAESQETRERLLAVAQRLFAQHGYAGTSIRDLGSALGVASSSVLHHVGSKRKLYALVLSRISDSLSGAASNIQAREGADMMREFAERMMTWSDQNPEYVQIVVREMMEIPDRLSEAHQWLLADFMQEALELSERATASRSASKVDAEMMLMLIIGAVTNFHVSLPTFMRLRGASDPLDMKQRFINTLDQLIRTTLAPQHGRRSDDPVR